MMEQRKFLIIGDGSEESRIAAYFAARRAHNTRGQVTVLATIEPSNFGHWLGVSETMRREAMEAAEAALESLAEDIEAVTGGRPEVILREGELLPVLREVIEADPGIAILVLGARTGEKSPGALVSALARGRGLFGSRSIPVTIVPGDLSREEIDHLT